MIPSATALIVSCQLILGSFFLSILGIKQTRHSAYGGGAPAGGAPAGGALADGAINPSGEPAAAR